ncbi:MAG TPA: DUF6262 family protein [Acidimicrobiales bacterium]|nr:DUF6262 family protein [Acidimicrobiales bacterium]
MKIDNSAHLASAARRRSDETRRRAEQALWGMDRAGGPISFTAVAAAASVSRSWLYRDSDLRTEIHRLRAAGPAAMASRPAAERSSTASQHRRIATLLDANRTLRTENQQLRGEVAALLGERRDHVCGPPS